VGLRHRKGHFAKLSIASETSTDAGASNNVGLVVGLSIGLGVLLLLALVAAIIFFQRWQIAQTELKQALAKAGDAPSPDLVGQTV